MYEPPHATGWAQGNLVAWVGVYGRRATTYGGKERQEVKLALVYTGAGTFYGQPMGLLFLAAWLKRHAPTWQVWIVDANWEDPLDVLLREPWDVCGITAMTGGRLYDIALGFSISWGTVLNHGSELSTPPPANERRHG